jgi:hypothetical protein
LERERRQRADEEDRARALAVMQRAYDQALRHRSQLQRLASERSSSLSTPSSASFASASPPDNSTPISTIEAKRRSSLTLPPPFQPHQLNQLQSHLIHHEQRQQHPSVFITQDTAPSSSSVDAASLLSHLNITKSHMKSGDFNHGSPSTHFTSVSSSPTIPAASNEQKPNHRFTFSPRLTASKPESSSLLPPPIDFELNSSSSSPSSSASESTPSYKSPKSMNLNMKLVTTANPHSQPHHPHMGSPGSRFAHQVTYKSPANYCICTDFDYFLCSCLCSLLCSPPHSILTHFLILSQHYNHHCFHVVACVAVFLDRDQNNFEQYQQWVAALSTSS